MPEILKNVYRRRRITLNINLDQRKAHAHKRNGWSPAGGIASGK
ncbi:MAG: hypothetical protein V1793_11860 [Pseudomonadota bacterium]